jgi:hypothetical protein
MKHPILVSIKPAAAQSKAIMDHVQVELETGSYPSMLERISSWPEIGRAFALPGKRLHSANTPHKPRWITAKLPHDLVLIPPSTVTLQLVLAAAHCDRAITISACAVIMT